MPATPHAQSAHHTSPRNTWLAALAAVTIAIAIATPDATTGTTTQPDEQPPATPTDRDVAVEVRVTLIGGDELTGVLVRETPANITLRVDGIESTLARTQIQSVDRLPPVLERYRDRRAAIDDRDVEARLILAAWLRDRAAYQTALEEVNGVLEYDRFNRAAQQLKAWLEQQIWLENQRKARGDPADRRPANERRTGERTFEIDGFPVLTAEEINLIRVFEIDLANPPEFIIPRDTVTTFIDLYKDHEAMPRTEEGREALRFASESRILETMFRVRARDLYREVRVREDPTSMALFRDRVHDWVVNSCATSNCHGGQEAGRLWLLNKRRNSDTTIYTNFVILDAFRFDDGTPLIDYESPADSALLQLALPRDISTRPHPVVRQRAGRRGWRPLYRDDEELRFRRAVEWVASMYKPRPDYQLDYEPPTPRGELRERELDEQGPVER